MAKVFVTDSGTSIQLNTGVDCASSTVHEIWVRKPSGTVVKYTATVSGVYLSYTMTSADLDEVGIYTASAYIESPTFTTGKHGEKADFEIFSVYTATGSDAFVSPDEFRHFLECYGITSDVLSDEWVRKRLTNFIVPFIERATRQSFAAITSVTELYSGNGKNIMILNRKPIVAVTSIRYVLGGSNLTYLNLNNIEISYKQGILKAKRNYEESYYLPVFAKGDYNIEVTYTYGYATPPADIKEAATYLLAEQALGFIANRTGGGDLSTEGWSRSFGTRGKYSGIRNDVSRQARFLLGKYLTRVTG